MIPVRPPHANAYAERFVLTASPTSPDRKLNLSERHLRSVLAEHVRHYNGCQMDGVQLRSGVLPPQRREFLAEHQQFSVLGRRRTRQKYHPADQADEHQVEHPYRHKPAMLPARGPLPQANPQVSTLCSVLEPYRVCKIRCTVASLTR